MRLLITGASGFVGSSLMAELSPHNEVWGLSRRRPAWASDPTRWIEHDLAADSLPPSLPERVDAIIHLAQCPSFRDFPESARPLFDVNVRGTMLLADWARRTGVGTVVFVSSGGIFGPSPDPLTEDSPVRPQGPLGFYLAGKLACEGLLAQYAPHFKPIILRPFFIYGPRQRSPMLIARLIESVRTGQPLSIHTPRGLKLNPIFIDDFVRAVGQALRLDHPMAINVAGPTVATLDELGRAIGAAMNTEPRFQRLPAAPPDMVADISRMSSHLITPPTSLWEGVRKTIDARTNADEH